MKTATLLALSAAVVIATVVIALQNQSTDGRSV